MQNQKFPARRDLFKNEKSGIQNQNRWAMAQQPFFHLAGCPSWVEAESRLCANGISSSECKRLPAGSMMVGVTKMTRFFLLRFEDSTAEQLPDKRKVPRIGTLSLIRGDVYR